MPELLGQISAWMWLLFLVLWFMVGPLVLGFVAWRVLHDLHRIADALETGNIQRYYASHSEIHELSEADKQHARGMANSAFGR